MPRLLRISIQDKTVELSPKLFQGNIVLSRSSRTPRIPRFLRSVGQTWWRDSTHNLGTKALIKRGISSSLIGPQFSPQQPCRAQSSRWGKIALKVEPEP